MEPDPYALQLKGILELYGIAPGCIEGIIVSSVVPPLTNILEEALRRFTSVTPMHFTRALNTGVTIDIENPDELGADLLAGAAAAKAGYELPAIVLDLGTATKLTAIDKNGRVLGASIMPGVFISLNALVSGASLLGAVALQEPSRAIGRNSAQSMQSGVIYGAASMLDGMVERFEAEMGPVNTLLATGGAAGLIVPHCRHKMHHVPTLLLDGLYAVYQMNQ
jgi:type III pantothenate kinase